MELAVASMVYCFRCSNPGIMLLSHRPTPLRKRGDSEEGSEIIARGGGTPGGAKRRRRDGTDVPGHRICHFKLTADDNVDFMNRIRVSC